MGLIDKVVFEPFAPRQNGKKQPFTYDQSLARLRETGWRRHPLPAETFAFLISRSEDARYGPVLPDDRLVRTDMFTAPGEWLSCAFERQGDRLAVYHDPEGLVWDGTRYAVPGKLGYGRKQTFHITGDPSGTPIPLMQVQDGLVAVLCGRIKDELPREIVEKTTISLPPDGVLWPVGRCGFTKEYVISGHFYRERASRGARQC